MPKKGRAFLFQMEDEDNKILDKAMSEHLQKHLVRIDKTNVLRQIIRWWGKYHKEIEWIEAERTLAKLQSSMKSRKQVRKEIEGAKEETRKGIKHE